MGEEKYKFPQLCVSYEEAYARLVALVQNCERVLRTSPTPEALELYLAVKDVR